MLRLINLVDDDDNSRPTEVLIYRSGDWLTITVNLEARCIARLVVPATGSFEECLGRIGIELAESSPLLRASP